MAATGQFNTRSPTVKRILREAAELTQAPSPDYAAAPLETNLFEWHFTIRGPPATAYADGLYHGRIVLPPTYPLRPPMFRFSTPSGRFEPNREICLSISGHHEESWQPAWGVRTALVAIRAFMESDAKGQVGGVDASPELRVRLARESRDWRCPACNRTNHDIMKEREEEAREANEGEENKKSEEIPEELRLGYRDELGAGKKDQHAAAPAEAPAGAQVPAPTPTVPSEPTVSTPQARIPAPQAQRSLARVPPITVQSRRRQDESTGWLDMAIGGLAVALVYMVIRKLATWM